MASRAESPGGSNVNYGPEPQTVVCPYCHARASTTLKDKATGKTHIIAGVLCVIGCWCLVFLPYCLKWGVNIDHYCSECKAYLGTYKR